MRLSVSLIFAVFLYCFLSFNAFASAHMSNSKRIKISHISSDISIDKLSDPAWAKTTELSVGTYWSGERAPKSRNFKARFLWSETALYIRFEANQTEPLVVSDRPDITKKTKGLWDRDVCEIFIAPEKNERNKYFEFEVAPTGEWIDLGIQVLSNKRETDWDYASGMQRAVKIEKDKVVMAIKIEWKALRKTPTVGDIWLGNLFRCVGKDPTRGYLAWQPTKTKEPAFHVPEAFGEFQFVK